MEQFIVEYILVALSIFILLITPRYRKLFWLVDDNNHVISIKSRLWQIDTIKGLSILAVVIIHTCYLLLPLYNKLYNTITLSLINNFFRFAIPVFLFSSGLLLKPFVWDKYAVLKFYSSKFIRIGIPYILICVILWILGYNNSASLLKLIITGDIAVPFYFIPVLFQLYLIYPILDYLRRINPSLLLTVSFIVSTVSFFSPSTWEWGGVSLLWQYLIFFVYGMVRKDILNSKISPIWREFIWIYLILQLLSVLLVQLMYSEIGVIFPMNLYNFQILFGFGFIFTTINILHSQNKLKPISQKLIAPLGRISLWIFLLHFPIQETIFNLTKDYTYSLAIELLKNIILTLIITIPIAIICDLIYAYLKTPYKYVIIKKN